MHLPFICLARVSPCLIFIKIVIVFIHLHPSAVRTLDKCIIEKGLFLLSSLSCISPSRKKVGRRRLSYFKVCMTCLNCPSKICLSGNGIEFEKHLWFRNSCCDTRFTRSLPDTTRTNSPACICTYKRVLTFKQSKDRWA